MKDKIAEVIKAKKFIKDSEHYPDTKVLLVKGGTKDGIEIGLSDYCAKEYAKIILDLIAKELPKEKATLHPDHPNWEAETNGYNQAIKDIKYKLGE